METILVVEDDESILLGITINLEAEGYAVEAARDGVEGVEAFRRLAPDLVVLDVMLPRLNGFEVLTTIRRADHEVPVVLLSARDTQSDKVVGLDLGADDYVTKPFGVAELLARVKAALRRRRLKLGPSPGQIVFSDVQVDTVARRVTRAGSELEMTAREYDLLVYLARSRGRVLSRAQILQAVWGDEYDGTERTVDNFIVRLRNKVEADPDQPKYIETVRGVGYRFNPGS